MTCLIYLRRLLLAICLIAFTALSPVQAAGTNSKVWTDPVTKDEMTTVGWEWHTVRKEFYENFSLTKNVFEFFPEQKAQISLQAEKIKEKLKDYSFASLESTGYSLYLFFSGDKIVEGSSLISDLSEHRTIFELNTWQKISNEYPVEKEDGVPTTKNLLKFDFQMEFNYATIDPAKMKPPYLAISRLQKYYKFSRGYGDDGEPLYDVVFFNFTKNNTDYLVQVDNEPVDLKDLKHWTNLNFPGVVKERIKDLAVSKLNDSYMLLTFNIRAKEEHFENSAICLSMKYYHDVHNNAQNTFAIVSQPRKAADKQVFNKLLEYCSFRTNANDVKQKNWLDLRYCISKQFLTHNLVYLVATLDEGSQLSLFPDLTAAIADPRIERKTENLNDFLYAWSTGTFDPHDEWYTTPVVDNFRLRRVEGTNQTYLELINDQNSKIDVYYLVSNSFGLTNDMRLTFNLNNNHSDAAELKIYLVEETEKRRLIGRIDLNQVSEEKPSYSFNLTDSVYESNRAFSAIDMDEEYIDRFERLANREKNRDKGELDKDKDKEELDKTTTIADHKPDEPGTETPEPQPEPEEPDDDIRPPRTFAKLIFEFTLKHFLEENDSPEKLTLYNVNLMDPCYKNIDQCKLGKCISDAVDKWHCQCDENAHGKVHCEFHDMCKSNLTKQYIEKHRLIVPDDAGETLTGNLYCAQRKAKGCSPIDNRILCICQEGEYWNYKAQSCQKIDACSYVYCSENEECYLDRQTKKPKCRCKFNYYPDESTGQCEPDYCRGEKINKLYCKPTQDCLNDLVNGRPVCDCKFGFTRQGADCSAWSTNNLPKSPFVKQYYGCDHTYELSKDKQMYVCRCFEGWKLQDDQRTCKPEFDITKCPECSIKQVCVRAGSNQTTCICKVGHQGRDRVKCEKDFCNEPSMKRLVKKSCASSEECSLFTARTVNPIFHCACKPGFSSAHKQNGVCELKNVCNMIEQVKCAEIGGYCVPRMLSGTLTPVCECSIGFDKDASGKCVPLDQLVDCKKFNAFKAYVDVRGDRAVCSCLPGYVYDPVKKNCVLSPKDTVHVSVVVFLKHLTDEPVDRDEIPDSSYSNRPNQANKFKIFDCNHPNLKLPNKEHCYSLTNAAYQPLVELNRELMMKNVEYQLYHKVRALFYYIQGDEDLSISMISFDNITEIDENEYGYNTKYRVNIALVSGMIGGDVLQENLDKMCQEREQEEEEKSIKSTEFKGFCFLDKQLLPISRTLKVVGSLNLCNLKTMQCPAYSSCRHELKGRENEYSCVCNKGFKSLHQIKEFNLKIEVCEDVDECTEPGAQHDCGPNTNCDNLIGSYRCECKTGYKRVNKTDCEKTCSSSFPCVHGKCETYQEHYEICRCDDGYKGEDCSKEDQLVILLKDTLMIVSVGLGLMLVVVIAIAVFCIKSVRKQRRKDEDHQICLDDLK